MTAFSVQSISRLTVHGSAPRIVRETRVDDALAVRRCAQHRRVFQGFAVSYPADALLPDAVAHWIRRHGVTVDVASVDDLDLLALAGIDPSHVVMHCAGFDSSAIVRAVEIGVTRFVVSGDEHIALLTERSHTTTLRVLVDADRSAELAVGVAAQPQLDLVGLHYRVGETEAGDLTAIVDAMVARMAWLSRKHDRLLSRLSLGDVELTAHEGDPWALRREAERVEQAVEDACIRWRYLRPALTVSLR